MKEPPPYSPEEISFLFGLDEDPGLKVRVFQYLKIYGNYLKSLRIGNTPDAVRSLASASDEERMMPEIPPETLDVIVKRFFGL